MIDGDTAALVSKMKNRDPKWVSYGTVKFWVIRNILWFTGLYFVCTCCSGSHIFQTVAVLSVSLRLEFVHLLRSVVCTRGLPRSCRSRVVSGCTSSFWSAVHFNEGGSEASVCQVPSRIRGVITLKHWTRARALLTRCSSSSHGRNNLVWMDGWMGLNLCANWSCDRAPHTLHGRTLGDSPSSPNRVRQEWDSEARITWENENENIWLFVTESICCFFLLK